MQISISHTNKKDLQFFLTKKSKVIDALFIEWVST